MIATGPRQLTEVPLGQVRAKNLAPFQRGEMFHGPFACPVGKVGAGTDITVVNPGTGQDVRALWKRWSVPHPDGSERNVRLVFPCSVPASSIADWDVVASARGSLPPFAYHPEVAARRPNLVIRLLLGAGDVSVSLHEALVQIEDTPYRQVFRSFHRFPGTPLWAELHLYYFAGLAHAQFDLEWGCSDPRWGGWFADLAAVPNNPEGHLWLLFAGAEPIIRDEEEVAKSRTRGPGYWSYRLFHGLTDNALKSTAQTMIGDGQQVMIHEGVLIFSPQASEGPGAPDADTADALRHSQLLEGMPGWPASGGHYAFCDPLDWPVPANADHAPVMFADIAAAKFAGERDASLILGLHPAIRTPFCNGSHSSADGLFYAFIHGESPGDTGAQAAFGFYKGHPVHRGELELIRPLKRSVLKMGAYASWHRDVDGTPADITNHPELRMWAGNVCQGGGLCAFDNMGKLAAGASNRGIQDVDKAYSEEKAWSGFAIPSHHSVGPLSSLGMMSGHDGIRRMVHRVAQLTMFNCANDGKSQGGTDWPSIYSTTMASARDIGRGSWSYCNWWFHLGGPGGDPNLERYIRRRIDRVWTDVRFGLDRDRPLREFQFFSQAGADPRSMNHLHVNPWMEGWAIAGVSLMLHAFPDTQYHAQIRQWVKEIAYDHVRHFFLDNGNGTYTACNAYRILGNGSILTPTQRADPEYCLWYSPYGVWQIAAVPWAWYYAREDGNQEIIDKCKLLFDWNNGSFISTKWRRDYQTYEMTNTVPGGNWWQWRDD